MKSAKNSLNQSRRNILGLILVLFLAGILQAESFPLRYTLMGHPRIENGMIDVYKIPQGMSIFRNTARVFSAQDLRTKIDLDYEKRQFKLRIVSGSIEDIYPPVVMSLDTYYLQHYRRIFREELYDRSLQLLAERERSAKQGLIGEFTFKLPEAAKKSRFVRGVLGKKAGSLSLDGSEKITIGGSSSKRNSAGDESSDNIDFDLNMMQELNLRLRGTIGEKIHVNVNHQSSTGDDFISNPSTVEMSYEGTEDEVIKSIEGGNISLSLSGSKYISYTASSEGLFGIKSDLEVGNLDLTLILGKDEAQKETQRWEGSAQSDSSAIVSENYDIRHFYYITDPQSLFLLYGDPQGDAVLGTEYPPTYENNAIRTDGGKWIMKDGADDILPKPQTLHVYFDDNTSNNQDITTLGKNEFDESDGTDYSFMELIEGTDFTFDYDSGLLYINRVVSKQHVIAVIYEQDDGGQVGYYSQAEGKLHVKVLKRSNQNFESHPDYWKLEARNIYKIGENIQSEGFELYIFDDTASDGTQTLICPGDIGAGYAETYNDYLRLDNNGDGVINGEDQAVSLAAGYITFSFLEPFYALGDQVLYEEDPTTILPDDIIMYISVKGKVGRDQVSLGVMNILPSSVKITLGEGATKKDLKENVDYIVDYDFGMISFLTDESRDAEAILNITYDYKQLFAVDNTTLAGVRADWDVNENLTFGGTFIYHNEKVKEDHPKIGSENMTLILSDLDGRMEYELPFFTRALDWLPLIVTDEESSFSLSGEMAMSIPQIYGNSSNPDEAYIDDMEAILDSYPLGVVRSGWSPASRPYNTDYARSRPNWFNAQNIYRKDVYNPESLTTEEESEEITVLAIRLNPPDIHNPGMMNRYWGGLMKYVGNQVDFSNKKYIEVLVKVDSLKSNPKPIVMHVDLGDMSEDFYTDFGGEGVLNTEDGANGGFADGSLDQYGDVNEDIGLDMIPDDEAGDDPNDNFDNVEIEGEYPWINGTEDNDRLDSEDLDNNGELNDSNIYYEYTVTLKDTTYLESEYNDWYLYRIPVDDPDDYNIISNSSVQPDLERISFARVWFETQEDALVKLVNFDLIGNKWEENYIRDEDEDIISVYELESNREKMQVSVVDNQKNIHYTPAPGSVIKENNEETLEQSMFIEYTNLQPDHHGLVRQKLRDEISLINYEKIRFWVFSEMLQNDTADLEHDLVIRIGKDSLNYYEINYPLTAQEYQSKMDVDGWLDMEFDFSQLSYLKSPESDDSTYVEVDNYYSYYYVGDTRYELHKTPTLSYIEEFSLGIENNSSEPFTGRIYFDDIRVANPYSDIGYATRGTFNLRLADFATFDANAEWKTDNFKNRAERNKSSSNTYKTTSLNMSSNVNLHKFLPAQWGFNMPLTLSRNELFKQSRFKANSDILWEDMNDIDKDREKTHTLKYRADLSLGLSKSPNSSWKIWNSLVEYTAKATSLSGYIEKNWDVEPTSTDTTLAYQVKHTYKLSIPKDKVSFNILKNYSIGYFPNSFNNTLTYKANLPEGRRWRWSTTGDSASWEPQTNVVNTKTLSTSSTVKYDMLSDLSFDYSIKTSRDMQLEKYWQDYNIGTEKSRDQGIKIRYSPKYLSNLFSFSTNVNIDYDDKTKKKSYNSEDEDFYYDGGVKRGFSSSITLKNHDIMNNFVNWVWTDTPAPRGENPDENTSAGNKPPDSINPKDDNEFMPPKDDGFEDDKELMPPKDEERPRDDRMPDFIDPDEKEGRGELKDPKKHEKPEEHQDIIDDDQIEEDEEVEEITPPRPRINPIKWVFQYLGGLENIQLSFDNDYSTDFDEQEERPSIEYQLGIPHILREEDVVDSLTGEVLEKQITMRQDVNHVSASTGFPILKNLTTQLSFDWQLSQKYTSSPTQTLTVNFPNVRVQLNEFNTLLGIEEVLKSSSLSSSYAVNNKKTGIVDWIDPNTDETTINLSPLFSWSGNWINDISSHLNLNHRQTESTTFQETGNIINESTSQSATGDISWSFSAEKGIKIPFTQERWYIKNETTLRLDASYERSWSIRKTNDNPDLLQDEQNNLNIRPQISYDFSKNITAGLTSEYRINNNVKNSNKVTTFSLSMWVEIVF